MYAWPRQVARAADLSKPPRYVIGIGAHTYPGMRALTWADFRHEARAVMAGHQAWSGFPLMTTVECNGTLRVAEGSLRIGGELLVEVGYGYHGLSQVLSPAGRYIVANHSSQESWLATPPAEAVVAEATVVRCLPSGRPTLFVSDPDLPLEYNLPPLGNFNIGPGVHVVPE